MPRLTPRQSGRYLNTKNLAMYLEIEPGKYLPIPGKDNKCKIDLEGIGTVSAKALQPGVEVRKMPATLLEVIRMLKVPPLRKLTCPGAYQRVVVSSKFLASTLGSNVSAKDQASLFRFLASHGHHIRTLGNACLISLEAAGLLTVHGKLLLKYAKF